MKTYTAFCQGEFETGTTWISTVEADSVASAIDRAAVACAEDWGCDVDDVHVLGIAAGDVKIEFWEDANG